jgi:hypothetical protein
MAINEPMTSIKPAAAMKEDERTNTNRQAATLLASWRKLALAAGLFYLLTFVSIPTLALYGSVHDPNYIAGPGPDTPVLVGGVLEIVVGLAGIGTAVALYPVVKRQNQAVALGFVGTRILEASAIFAGVASLLTLVTLRQAGVGTEGLVTGRALVALYDRFFLAQSLMPVMNALLLGSLLYRSRLVPRILPLLGLIGAPVLLVATLAAMFGLIGRTSGVAALTTIPIALWEFSLGVWLVVKGFNRAATIALAAKPSDWEPLVAPGAGPANS